MRALNILTPIIAMVMAYIAIHAAARRAHSGLIRLGLSFVWIAYAATMSTLHFDGRSLNDAVFGPCSRAEYHR